LTFDQKHPILLPNRHCLTASSVKRMKYIITRAFRPPYTSSVKNFGCLMAGIRSERSCERACAVFDSMLTQLSTKWEISLQPAYAKPYRSPIQALISAARSTLKRRSTAIKCESKLTFAYLYAC